MQMQDDFKKVLFSILLMTALGMTSQASATSDLLNPKKLFSALTPTSNPTATLQFTKEGKRLYIYILIQQTKEITNEVKVVWKSPETSICGDSEYALKYSGLQYKTKAYRTVSLDTQDGDPLVCVGDWKVSIIDPKGHEIASGIFNVKDEGVLDQAVMSSPNVNDETEEELDLSSPATYPPVLAKQAQK
jgi:hypothetical protein